MNMDNFKPLQEWMDSIPEPKWWQIRTRIICWLSDRIDDHNTRKHLKRMKYKGSIMTDKESKEN